MLALLNDIILWWHWIALGLILLILEMSTGTFIMLGLGIAAILVGIMDYFLVLSLSEEISVWMALSVAYIMIWFKFFKKDMVSDSGQSNYRLDTLGHVTKSIEPPHRGMVLFDAPVLGNTIWHATSKSLLPENTRIKIVDIHGQLIEVAAIIEEGA